MEEKYRECEKINFEVFRYITVRKFNSEKSIWESSYKPNTAISTRGAEFTVE